VEELAFEYFEASPGGNDQYGECSKHEKQESDSEGLGWHE